MSTVFERTMASLKESKERKPLSAAKKTLTENKKKLPAKKEGVISQKAIKKESAPEEELTMTIIDPELPDENFIKAAADAQKIVDRTPDGEEPATDKYVGDRTYQCPACGNIFLSEKELEEGEECPVCGEVPDGFAFTGIIADVEAPEEAEEAEESEDEEDFEDTEEESEDDSEEVEDPEDEDKEDLEECDDRKDEKEHEEPMEEAKIRNVSVNTRSLLKRESKKMPARASSMAKKESALYIDETTFNKYLGRFVRENYENIRAMRVVGARRSGNTLKLECEIKFKSGNSKKTVLYTENFAPAQKMIWKMNDSGAFKVESKKTPPFVFKAVMNKGVIACEGLRYNFVTSMKNEKYQVYGGVLKEDLQRGE